LLAERSAHGRVRPDLERGLDALLLALGVADVQLAVAGLALAARVLELLAQVLVWRGGDEGVSEPAGEPGGSRLGGRDRERRRLVGQRVDPRLLDAVVLPVVRLV